VRMMHKIRRELLRLGREFVEAGELEREDDLVYLTTPELRAFAGGQALPWRERIAERRGAYRREYWRFLGWAAAHHPRKMAAAIRHAAAGHHYITYTRETVLPALERTRAELMATAAAATAAAGRRCAR